MILEGKTETIVLEDGDVQESTQMSIDKDSHIFLMRMLSKFYSDGIGSLIRETASNALDSHRECGVTDPIIVSFKPNKDGNFEFSVQDFGCGIDDKDVENIISKYGKSTKRNSDTQLGAFGLGFKSPLAYTPSFYFVGRKGGIERKWMLYESDDESNKIDLLYESPTEERNGVKIIVPVKWSDRNEFYNKIREQLAYFESVYFDCGNEIQNNFNIIRHEDFQWSPLVRNDKLHICLDNVYYPLDFSKLGIQQIYFPVALRFSLTDGLFPIPNREQLKYTPEAKTAILAKIEKVAEYFIKKYNEGVKDTDDVFAVIDHFQNTSRYIDGYDGRKLSVSALEVYSKTKFIDPKLNNVKYLSMKRIYELRDYLIQEYVVKYNFSNGRFQSTENRKWRSTLNYRNIEQGHVYLFTEMLPLKKAYLRETLPGGWLLFVRKDKTIRLGNASAIISGSGYDNWMKMLQLHHFPRTEWRERIKEAQYVISLFAKSFIDVDKIEAPKEWYEGRKKQKVQAMAAKGTNVRRKKLTGEITAKISSPLERYVSGKNCKFVPTVIQMKDAHRAKYSIIYGDSSYEEKFQKWFTVTEKKNVKFAILSERELKNLKDIELHNWQHFDKFMEGKHIIFRRTATAYLIDKLSDDYPSVFNKFKILKDISTPLGEKLEKLVEYKRDYFIDGERELLEDIVKVAEEKNLFDTTIYPVYKEVKSIFEKLPFLQTMFSNMNYNNNEAMLKATIDLFKYYKQRINWEHYKENVQETQLIEEELTN